MTSTPPAKERMSRDFMAAVIARRLPPGWLVNLGIGMPTMVAAYVHPEQDITFTSENGVIGYAGIAADHEVDIDVVNAGIQYVTLKPGAAIVSHAAVQNPVHDKTCTVRATSVAPPVAAWEGAAPRAGAGCACFTVSRAGSAASAAPVCAAASTVAVTSAADAHGRAASCTSTISGACGARASSPARTLSWRVAPPRNPHGNPGYHASVSDYEHDGFMHTSKHR